VKRFTACMVALAVSFIFAASAHSEPQKIRVGVYVLSLGKLDIASATFTSDFYLQLDSDQPIPDSSFELMHGQISSIEKTEDTAEKETVNGAEVTKYEKFYRIKASHETPIDLHRFPFDRQQLVIQLEDKTHGTDEVVYEPDMKASGLDEDVYFTGWRLLGWKLETPEHGYPVYDETFSRLRCSIGIERVKFNMFLKTFLPVIFLMLIVMASFILDPEKVTTRLAAISSGLVASAMFHISISNQIPAVGYPTFADKFMLLTYLLLLCSFFLSIRVFMLQGRNDLEKAKKLNKLSELLVLIGMPVLYTALFLFM
jgi:hypothetical protein